MKRCGSCKQELSFDQFNRNASQSDGLGTKCRSCMKLYRKSYYLANRKSLIAKTREQSAVRKKETIAKLKEYLSEHPCVDCATDDIRVLEFDHRDRAEKEERVSALVCAGYVWPTILVEVEKCDVRCANCHRIRTQQQFGSFRSLWV